jgi:predicted RNA binding protein YcfA (HicA-like mRNA interferase family)
MGKYRKDVAEFIKHAACRGFTEDGMNGRGHWRLRHPSGATVTVAATPHGGRWRKNAEADLRRIERNTTK